MEFFEAPAFTRCASSYLSDDEYREMQGRLASAPESGDMIPGTGGFRKLRWAALKCAIEGELLVRQIAKPRKQGKSRT